MVPLKLQKMFPPSLVGASNVFLPCVRLWPRIGTLFGFGPELEHSSAFTQGYLLGEKRTGMGRATLLARTAHAAVLVLTFSEFKTLSLSFSRTLSNLQSGLAFSKLWVLRRRREEEQRQLNSTITTPSGREVADARKGMFHSSLWPLSWSLNKNGTSLVCSGNLPTERSSSLHDF